MSYQTYLETNPWKSHWIISDIAACLSPTCTLGHCVCYPVLAVLPADTLQLQKQAAKPAAQTLKRTSRTLCSPMDRMDSATSGFALWLLSQKEEPALLSCVLAATLVCNPEQNPFLSIQSLSSGWPASCTMACRRLEKYSTLYVTQQKHKDAFEEKGSTQLGTTWNDRKRKTSSN